MKGVKQYRSKSTKGNPGLSGVHLFWTFHPAVYLFLLAVGVAVGLYFGLRPLIGSEEVGWMCILGAAPFAACGFFKVPWDDRRTSGMGLVQVGISVSEKACVQI